jgi:hypothetical protein
VVHKERGRPQKSRDKKAEKAGEKAEKKAETPTSPSHFSFLVLG